MLLVPVVLFAACGGGSGPEETVKDYYAAISAGDPERLAATFVPGVEESIAGAALLPVSITNLAVELEAEYSESAKVLAEYDADFLVETSAKVRFHLERQSGRWLIADIEAVASSRR